MLTVQLLGGFRILEEDRPAGGLRSRKNEVLLAYLLLEGDREHKRSTLAGLLWPDSTDKAAALNLRQALHRLKKRFPEELFTITRQSVTCHVSAEVIQVDVVSFIRLLNSTRVHTHDERHRCADCMRRLATVADLYRGDFLAGLFLSGNVTLEKWILLQREWLQQQVLTVFDELTHFYREGLAWDSAEKTVRQQLSIDPLRESGQRHLMSILAARNNRPEAIKQYEAFRHMLQTELSVEPADETRRLAERIRQRAEQSVEIRLPQRRTAFFGRSAEIKQLTAQLLDHDRRLITLVGMGGIGKTRLAITVADRLQTAFPDGIWFVSLASIESTADEAQLWSHIAATLAIQLNPTQLPQTKICTFLQQKDALLILDNCEHLLDQVANVAELLLDQTQRLTLLTTSREPLGFYFEFIATLDGLPFPQVESVDDAAFPAVSLFVRRAQLTTNEQRDRQTRRAVHEICGAVDGHPLAIELVASATRHKPLTQIAASLAQDSDLLSSRLRGFAKRHQSVQAVFDWSWRLLPATLQTALMRLTVFKGGWTVEAAVRVANVDESALVALFDKSLLRRNEEWRYDFHALIGRFSAEKQLPTTAQTALHDAHAHHYLTTLAAAAQTLRSSQQLAERPRWNLEIANIEAAWTWAIEQQHPALLANAADSLATLMILRGTYAQGKPLFETAVRQTSGQHLARLRIAYAPVQSAMGQNDIAIRELENVLVDSDVSSAVADCVAVEQAMLLVYGQIDFRRARKLAERGFSAELPTQTQARAHLCYALSSTRLHNYTDNATHYQMALEIFRTLDDREGEARTLQSMGFDALRRGQIEAALALHTESLAIARRFELHAIRAVVLNHMSSCYGLLHDFAMEEHYLLEAAELNRELERPHDLAIIYANLGINSTEFGDYDAALNYYRRSIDMGRRLNVKSLAWFLNNLGLLYEHQERYDETILVCEEARTLAEASGSRIALQMAHLRLAQAHTGLHNFEQAVSHLNESEGLMISAEDHRLIEIQTQRLAVALCEQDSAKIAQLIESIYRWLTIHNGKLLREPFRTRLLCYHGLQALHDDRAPALLATAIDQLHQQSAKIENPARRKQHLENVPAHRQLLALSPLSSKAIS